VKGRRRRKKDSWICPCCSLRHCLWPIDEWRVLDRDLQRKSELQCNKSEFAGGRLLRAAAHVVALPCNSFVVPSSPLFTEHSVITSSTSFVLAGRVQITSTNRVDSFRRYRPMHSLHCVPFCRSNTTNNYLLVSKTERHWLSSSQGLLAR
jgi:hypothetical protein